MGEAKGRFWSNGNKVSVVTRFELGRPIRSWRSKRDAERNEALDTLVYAHAALHGLISMQLRMNKEVEGLASVPARPGTEAGRVIRSAWIRGHLSIATPSRAMLAFMGIV